MERRKFEDLSTAEYHALIWVLVEKGLLADGFDEGNYPTLEVTRLGEEYIRADLDQQQADAEVQR